MQRAAAWLVHVYTASGLLCAFLALAAAVVHDVRTALGWLVVQVVIDATDGVLARAARVGLHAPRVNGAHLDDIVDYLAYVLVPAFIVWHEPLVPAGIALPVAAAMLIASAFGFSRVDAKTDDHFFIGFPSYWNIVVLYLVAFQSRPWVNALWLIALVALVFVPTRYVYPSRTVAWRSTTLSLGALWALGCVVMVWRLPTVPPWLLTASIVFPIYYVLLSIWLDGQRRGRVL